MKQPDSAEIKQWLPQQDGPLLRKRTIRERPGKWCIGYWQEGGGYDRDLTEGKAWDAAIEDFHRNPVRRGLVTRPELWRWSSARFSLDRTRPLDEALPGLQMVAASMWA
jgi:putative transposase